MEGRLGRLIERLKPRGPRTHAGLERRIPNYRDRMAIAAEDFRAGKGVILELDGTITRLPGTEVKTQQS